MRETLVRSLGWEDPLEKGRATHSSILAWRIPWGHEESDTAKLLSLSLSFKRHDNWSTEGSSNFPRSHRQCEQQRHSLQPDSLMPGPMRPAPILMLWSLLPSECQAPCAQLPFLCCDHCCPQRLRQLTRKEEIPTWGHRHQIRLQNAEPQWELRQGRTWRSLGFNLFSHEISWISKEKNKSRILTHIYGI